MSIYQSVKSSNQLRLARFFCFHIKKMSSESWIQWIIIKSHWCFTIYTAKCYHSETLPLSSCSFCTIVQTVFFRREQKSHFFIRRNRPRIKQHERCKFPDFKYITYLLTLNCSPLPSSHVPFSFTTLTFCTCSDLCYVHLSRCNRLICISVGARGRLGQLQQYSTEVHFKILI